jgi:hypothetical protein
MVTLPFCCLIDSVVRGPEPTRVLIERVDPPLLFVVLVVLEYVPDLLDVLFDQLAITFSIKKGQALSSLPDAWTGGTPPALQLPRQFQSPKHLPLA